MKPSAISSELRIEIMISRPSRASGAAQRVARRDLLSEVGVRHDEGGGRDAQRGQDESCWAAGWITRPILERWIPGVSDAGIAMLAALALFLAPVSLRKREFALDWSTAQRIPWGVIVLFGGGLSLADAIERTGLASWLAAGFGSFASWPFWMLVGLVVLVVVLFSELASNTATAAAFLPVVGALALSTGRDPMPLVIAAGLAASGGYMLPVATPPNAIVYGTGRISVPQLARAGAFLDLLFLILVPAVALLLVPLVFGR